MSTRQSRSQPRSALVPVLFLALTFACFWAVNDTVAGKGATTSVAIWVRFLEISYCSFVVSLVGLVLSFLPFLSAGYRAITRFGVLVGSVIPVATWLLLAQADRQQSNLGLRIPWEVASIPGKCLLMLLGRPVELLHDHFVLSFELEQFFLFLPLNVLGWLGAVVFFRVMLRFLQGRVGGPSVGWLVSSGLGCLIGILAYGGLVWEMPATTGLVVRLTRLLFSFLSSDLIRIEGPGFLAASPYWSGAVLLLALGIYRRPRT